MHFLLNTCKLHFLTRNDLAEVIPTNLFCIACFPYSSPYRDSDGREGLDMSRPSTSASGTTKEAPEKATEAAEKAAIEQFKRGGDFDAIRKDTLRRWEASEDGAAFLRKLRTIVTAEIERDRSLLARDRGKAATLVGGAVERTNLYQDTRLAAAKNVFQSQNFKQRIYDALKKYMPDEGESKEDVQVDKKISAQEAARAFIEREEGR